MIGLPIRHMCRHNMTCGRWRRRKWRILMWERTLLGVMKMRWVRLMTWLSATGPSALVFKTESVMGLGKREKSGGRFECKSRDQRRDEPSPNVGATGRTFPIGLIASLSFGLQKGNRHRAPRTEETTSYQTRAEVTRRTRDGMKRVRDLKPFPAHRSLQSNPCSYNEA